MTAFTLLRTQFMNHVYTSSLLYKETDFSTHSAACPRIDLCSKIPNQNTLWWGFEQQSVCFINLILVGKTEIRMSANYWEIFMSAGWLPRFTAGYCQPWSVAISQPRKWYCNMIQLVILAPAQKFEKCHWHTIIQMQISRYSWQYFFRSTLLRSIWWIKKMLCFSIFLYV